MVWSIGVWSLSLNSGYGVTGIVAVGLIWKFRLRRIMAEAIKKRGTPAQTRKGGRQHRQGKGDASTDKEGGKTGQRAGEGQEIFLHGISPSGRASRRGKTHAKNPSPLLFVLFCLSPSLPVLT